MRNPEIEKTFFPLDKAEYIALPSEYEANTQSELLSEQDLQDKVEELRQLLKNQNVEHFVSSSQ